MAKATKAKKAPVEAPGSKMIIIPALRKERVDIWVIGETPLIVHAWSKEARSEMLRKQLQLPTRKRKAKDPQQQLDACFYYTDDGRYGMRSVAFKEAAVGACRFVDAKMTEARQMFFVLGEVVPIYGADPVPREDLVRLGGKTADLRYRPMFPDWACRLEVEYDASVISPEQLVNLFSRAGMAPGVGDWRPERKGNFGRFRVANGSEWEQYVDRIPEVGSCQIGDLFEEVAE